MSVGSRAEESRSLWSSARLSACLSVLLVAEIVGLGVFGYYRVQRLLDPGRLADRAEDAIIANYPEFRADLVAQIEQQAPEIAERVSRRLMESTPAARQQLEEFTARQLDQGLDEATDLSAEKFRELLRNNREPIVTAFKKVEQAPDEARQVVLTLEGKLEKKFGVDVQKQAHTALEIHRLLNDKLARLADEDELLPPKEMLERQMVRILRTMQQQELKELGIARAELLDE